ncbi:transcription factor bHLH30-like [Henckelia pumila]|uniref:transcription factor bHLH30-like n=1 Tax=Henckelia pumila TaxID=405737 RepID=UPI003C6E0D7B
MGFMPLFCIWWGTKKLDTPYNLKRYQIIKASLIWLNNNKNNSKFPTYISIKMQQQNTTTDAYNMTGGFVNGGASTLTFPEVSQILPWNHSFNPTHFSTRDCDPFLLPPTVPVPCYGGGFLNRRPSGLQFGYEEEPAVVLSDHHLRLICDPFGPRSDPFCLHAELQKLTAQEIMDAKALAASKAHSEAERRRRERINNHLAKLRSLLPSTTKTDKASLLAEVIQHLKDLRRQTSLISETNQVPTEINELTVDNSSDEEGKLLIKASICCEDRPDLLSDLIQTLKSLKLRTLKAEITTLGGRVKKVLFITEDDQESSDSSNDDDEHDHGEQQHQHYCIDSIQEALKAVMEKSNGDDSESGSVKRQRTNYQFS